MHKYRYYAPLYNFSMDCDKLKINELSQIRQINKDEIRQFNSFKDKWDLIPHSGYVIEYYLEKDIPEESPNQYDPEGRKGLEWIVSTLRFFKEGLFGFNVFIHPYTEGTLAMSANYLAHYKTWMGSDFPIETRQYHLKTDEVSSYLGMIKSIIPSQIKKYRLAIDYFNKSYIEPYTPRDSLLDIMISLENLYLNRSTSEISFRLRLNASWLIGASSKERREIYDKLGKCYNIRSEIVHGSKEPKIDLLLFLRLRDITRKSIIKYLQTSDLVNEIADIILGKTKKQLIPSCIQ